MVKERGHSKWRTEKGLPCFRPLVVKESMKRELSMSPDSSGFRYTGDLLRSLSSGASLWNGFS